jgi:hypothetical protein
MGMVFNAGKYRVCGRTDGLGGARLDGDAALAPFAAPREPLA